jgi:hypothetical protein
MADPKEREAIPPDIAEATVITKDEWRVHRIASYSRTLPRDVHELLTDIEIMVANVLGSRSGNYSLNRSVEVLTIISRFLDEHRPELKALAKEWGPDVVQIQDSGSQAPDR